MSFDLRNHGVGFEHWPVRAPASRVASHALADCRSPFDVFADAVFLNLPLCNWTASVSLGQNAM